MEVKDIKHYSGGEDEDKLDSIPFKLLDTPGGRRDMLLQKRTDPLDYLKIYSIALLDFVDSYPRDDEVYIYLVSTPNKFGILLSKVPLGPVDDGTEE